MALTEMAGLGAAVTCTQDNVNMERRLAFGIIGYVADKRSDLDLLIIQNRAAQRANSGERGGVFSRRMNSRRLERTSSPVARMTAKVRCPSASNG